MRKYYFMQKNWFSFFWSKIISILWIKEAIIIVIPLCMEVHKSFSIMDFMMYLRTLISHFSLPYYIWCFMSSSFFFIWVPKPTICKVLKRILKEIFFFGKQFFRRNILITFKMENIHTCMCIRFQTWHGNISLF